MAPGTSGKQIAQEVARTFFTKTADRFTPRTKVHDGVADALALSTYYNAEHFADKLKEEDLAILS